MPSKADVKIQKIPPAHIAAIWPLVQPWLMKGLTAPTDLSMSDVLAGLREGTDHLWVVLEGKEVIGAFLTAIYEDEDDSAAKFLAAYALGGERLPEWAAQLGDVMADFAKFHKCNRVRFCSRRGWEKLLPSYRVVGEHGGYPIFERAVQ